MKEEKGQGLVETMLILPFLLILVVDIVEVDFEGSPKTVTARFIRLDEGCK